jgi:MFS family permease
MIVTLFPEPLERAKAFGVFSFVASAGAAVGLIAGGLITQAVSWHWIFFVNLPIGVATLVVSARLLDNDRGIGLGKGADVIGAITVTAALMLGVYTIVQTSDHGLLSLRTAALAAATAALLAGFVVRQARARNPILPLRLLRSRSVAGTNLVQALMSTAFFGFFFLGSLDLERVQGYGPMAIGLAFLPVAVVMALFSVRFSAQLIGRFGAGSMLVAGQVVAVTALALVALAPMHPNYFVHLLLPMALLGLGGGLSFPALTMIAMADIAPADAGLASGLLNTTGQVGGAFGLAVLATVAGGRTIELVNDGAGIAAALSGGYHFAWALCAGLVVVTVAAAAALLRPAAAGRMRDAECVECEAAA